MKTLKQIIILAAALCAVNTQAAPTFSVNAPSTVSTTAGGSGVSIYTLRVNSPTYFDGFNAPYNENPSQVFNGIFSSLSFDVAHSSPELSGLGGSGTAFSAPHTGGYFVNTGDYNLAISWTVDNATLPGLYNTALGVRPAGYLSSNGSYYIVPTMSYTTFDVSAAAVPEPTQAIAGCMLLGCGGLVFVSRRFIKKQAK